MAKSALRLNLRPSARPRRAIPRPPFREPLLCDAGDCHSSNSGNFLQKQDHHNPNPASRTRCEHAFGFGYFRRVHSAALAYLKPIHRDSHFARPSHGKPTTVLHTQLSPDDAPVRIRRFPVARRSSNHRRGPRYLSGPTSTVPHPANPRSSCHPHVEMKNPPDSGLGIRPTKLLET